MINWFSLRLSNQKNEIFTQCIPSPNFMIPVSEALREASSLCKQVLVMSGVLSSTFSSYNRDLDVRPQKEQN